MIYLIGGPTHTGKTVLAQRILDAYRVPYLSMDHLKMGLIRSGQTGLTPMDGEALTEYLWPIVREMVKTAIENRQSMTVEGCYLPYTWARDFAPEYRKEIKGLFLIMSDDYIRTHFSDILAHANDIERRLDDSALTRASLLRDNREALAQCQAHGAAYHLIDGEYAVPLPE